jgi:hypothetical protein
VAGDGRFSDVGEAEPVGRASASDSAMSSALESGSEGSRRDASARPWSVAEGSITSTIMTTIASAKSAQLGALRVRVLSKLARRTKMFAWKPLPVEVTTTFAVTLVPPSDTPAKSEMRAATWSRVAQSLGAFQSRNRAVSGASARALAAPRSAPTRSRRVKATAVCADTLLCGHEGVKSRRNGENKNCPPARRAVLPGIRCTVYHSCDELCRRLPLSC